MRNWRFAGIKVFCLDTTSLRLPFYDGSQQYDPVMSRLRRMREKNAVREEAATNDFWDRSKIGYSRVGWWRGKMRWFIAGNHAAKIKANMQVEQSLGREQPALWQPQEDQAQSGAYRLNLMEEEQRIALKNTAEFEQMARISGTYKALKAQHSPHAYSIDPLMDAEREYMASINGSRTTGENKRITADGGAGSPPGGYDRAELAALVPEEDTSTKITKVDKKPRMRNLRLLQIHNRELEIELLAEEVLGDIKSICTDPPPPAIAAAETPKPVLKVVEPDDEVLTMPAPIAEETAVLPTMHADAVIFG